MKKVISGGLYYFISNVRDEQIMPVLVLDNDREMIEVIPIITASYKGRTKLNHVKVKQFKKVRPNSILNLTNTFYVNSSSIKCFIDNLYNEQLEEVNSKINKIKKEYSNKFPHNFYRGEHE